MVIKFGKTEVECKYIRVCERYRNQSSDGMEVIFAMQHFTFHTALCQSYETAYLPLSLEFSQLSPP